MALGLVYALEVWHAHRVPQEVMRSLMIEGPEIRGAHMFATFAGPCNWSLAVQAAGSQGCDGLGNAQSEAVGP